MISLTGMVSAAALTSGLALSGRWLMRQRDALGRPRGFPTWSVSLLAIVAVAAAVPGVRRRAEEKRLSGVASVLVGHPVAVRCQSVGQALADLGSELGYVKYDAAGRPEARTVIKRDPCGELRKYYSGHRSLSLDRVIAVHVLTHEAMHMRGLTNEAEAECAAVQRDVTTAQLLGASPAQALELARDYWLTVYPRMPDDYRSGDCVPGGPADEHLDTAPWASVR
ncbi:MAG: hypothetical protein ABR549_15055 [Mycobacteriales bacterium]